MRNKQSAPLIERESTPPVASPISRGKSIVFSILAAFFAGLVASLSTVMLMGILRLVAGIPTPIELFGDFVLKRLPVSRFVDMLVFFSPHSKTTPLGLTLLSMIAVGTLLSLLYASIAGLKLPLSGYRPLRREWLAAAGLTLAMTLVAIALFWVEIHQNFLGLPLNWAALVTGLALFADFALYGLVLCLAYRALLPKQSAGDAQSVVEGRRQLLARAGVAVLGVGAGAGSLGVVQAYLSNYSSYDGIKAYPHGGVTSPITPNSEHYTVTQNPVDPSPSLAVWRLEMTGLVNNPGIYTYEEFTSLPSTSRAITLECIANGVGDHLISTAIWQGVPLRDLLQRHGGAQASARYIAFSGVDGYTVSLPLNEVLEVDPLLAFRMNGVALPQRHGYPVRALIPGRFGEENPKWLTRIELTDHFVTGLYASQGWYNGPLHTISRIDRPMGRVPFGSPIEIGGIAFAGNRGIQKVEVSTDKGVTWNLVQLTPPLSQDAWVLWTYAWQPLAPGRYTLTARATDGTGQTQTSQQQSTVPNGATGYPSVTVQVS